MNDLDNGTVSRNALLLLIAFLAETKAQAVDCMIHLWYSAMLSSDHIELLSGPVRKVVEDVCSSIAGNPANHHFAKTWQFGSSSLRLVLTKEQWLFLLASCTVRGSLDSHDAQRIRTNVTMAHDRRDYRDRALFRCPPIQRVCQTRFREDGMLLPFGKSRTAFTHPNPTLFQGDGWPLRDSADPLDGWLLSGMVDDSYGPASNDLYG